MHFCDTVKEDGDRGEEEAAETNQKEKKIKMRNGGVLGRDSLDITYSINHHISGKILASIIQKKKISASCWTE